MRPWRTALRRKRSLPSSVLGPVLFEALRRLAAICRVRSSGSHWRNWFVSSVGARRRGRHRQRGEQDCQRLRRARRGCFQPPVRRRQRMCLQPQGRARSRVNAGLCTMPLVPTAMQLAMMAAAKRHCVFVADLATECLTLRQSANDEDRGSAAANQTRLLGHESHCSRSRSRRGSGWDSCLLSSFRQPKLRLTSSVAADETTEMRDMKKIVRGFLVRPRDPSVLSVWTGRHPPLACICSTQGVLSRKNAASPNGRALSRVNLV